MSYRLRVNERSFNKRCDIPAAEMWSAYVPSFQPSMNGDGEDPDLGRGHNGAIVAPSRPETRQQVKRPPMYRVLLLNDDFTPMDFVVHVLQKFFQKEYNEAMQIMLQVHHQGAGIAGTFSHEIAETKCTLVNEYSKSQKHPLKATMEIA